jgi:hypothetical protein
MLARSTGPFDARRACSTQRVRLAATRNHRTVTRRACFVGRSPTDPTDPTVPGPIPFLCEANALPSRPKRTCSSGSAFDGMCVGFWPSTCRMVDRSNSVDPSAFKLCKCRLCRMSDGPRRRRLAAIAIVLSQFPQWISMTRGVPESVPRPLTA